MSKIVGKILLGLYFFAFTIPTDISGLYIVYDRVSIQVLYISVLNLFVILYLLKSFKKVDLTIKTHPKAKTKFDKIFFKKSNKIEENKYIDNRIFEKYDVFIFDSFTSAFTKVAATNKHIIFFNLNERKCVKKALRLIKKRTNFFDMNQIVKLNIAKVKLHTKKNYNKEFINQYSLYKNAKRSVSLIKLIDSIKVC